MLPQMSTVQKSSPQQQLLPSLEQLLRCCTTYWCGCSHAEGKEVWEKTGKGSETIEDKLTQLGSQSELQGSSTSQHLSDKIKFHHKRILVQLCHSSQLSLERGHIKSVHLISTPNFTRHQSTCLGSERLNRLARFWKLVHKCCNTLL